MVESSMKRTSVNFPYRECGVIALTAVSIFLGLALFTFAPVDLYVTESVSGNNKHNLVGQSGMLVATTTGFLLGWVAFSLPFLALSVAIRVGLGTRKRLTWPRFSVVTTAFVLVVAACCVLVQIHVIQTFANFEFAGGWLGHVLTYRSTPYLGETGLTLLTLTVVVVGVQLFFSFSWVNVGRRSISGLRGIASFCRKQIAATFHGIRVAGQFSWRILRRIGAQFWTLVEHVAKDDSPNKRKNPRKIAIRTAISSSTVTTKRSENLPYFDSGLNSATLLSTRVSDRKNAKGLDTNGDGKESTEQALIKIDTHYSLPSYDLLSDAETTIEGEVERSSQLQELGQRLQVNLSDFGVDANVVTIVPGPVVTRFELDLAAGVKVSKITNLVKDIARALAVPSVRVVPVIPGKTFVGVEVPNAKRKVVNFKAVLDVGKLEKSGSPLTFVLGSNIAGEPVFADIERMPHLLVAGTTGSGKSVGINVMLLSLLFRSAPDDVRLILIDPKMLELSVYEGVPHLLTPVVTDMEDAAKVLQWCVIEMERRYRLLSHLNVRNLKSYNSKIEDAARLGEPLLVPEYDDNGDDLYAELTKLPRILVVVDEFADLMMIVGKKVEQLIARIAQKARAAGIHLVLATQRPSVDVITGLIKANIPCRISFQVSSQVDSRTILDQQGAEQLLGDGDMLYLAPGSSVPERIHGAFVSDDEVLSVVQEIASNSETNYVNILKDANNLEIQGIADSVEDEADPLYAEAVEFVLESNKASISSVQRKLRVGYNRAANLIEKMQDDGIVSEPNPNGSREILVSNGE